jgi:hypothetical protein
MGLSVVLRDYQCASQSTKKSFSVQTQHSEIQLNFQQKQTAVSPNSKFIPVKKESSNFLHVVQIISTPHKTIFSKLQFLILFILNTLYFIHSFSKKSRKKLYQKNITSCQKYKEEKDKNFF